LVFEQDLVVGWLGSWGTCEFCLDLIDFCH
jgi:hypothetical protein